MLNPWPTMDISYSNRYHVLAQVDKVRSHFIPSARDNIAEPYDVHHFESATERVEFIDSLLVNNKYLLPIAEHVEDGVSGPYPKQRESKAANKRAASTLLPSGMNPLVYRHHISSSGK
jgi:hypothetical protein